MVDKEKPLKTAAPEAPAVSVGTSFTIQKYLFAFATQYEVRNYLRTQAIPDEAGRIAEILQAWQIVQPRVQELVESEAGLAAQVAVENLPQDIDERVGRILNSDLIRKTFQLPLGVALIDIDKLIVPHRAVNLDFISRLHSELPAKPRRDDLIKFCLSSERPLAPIQHLELGQNIHVFTSPSVDLRFLGAFLKDTLTTDDIVYAQMGGVPAAAIISFVGYGVYPVNVFLTENRIVLNNGFHRVYALRVLGIEKIPVLVQRVANPQLEFPAQISGVPKEYLLGHQRPVLVKDFFEPDFTTDIRVRNRLRSVTVQVNARQHDVPA